MAAGSISEAGDLANLDGRGSVFPVDGADDTLGGRCQRLEIHPTGPLWGEGTPAHAPRVLELELRLGARFPQESALCVAAGMAQERRSLRLAVRELAASRKRRRWCSLRLVRGGFATAVLRELIEAPPDADALPDAPAHPGDNSTYTAPVPAVRLPGGHKGQHGAGAAQDRVDRGLEHRPARTGAQPLAVDDPHAAHVLLEGVDEKKPQVVLRFEDREAVQIDLPLHAILATAQLAQHRRPAPAGDGTPAPRRLRPPGPQLPPPDSPAAPRRGRRA